MVEPYFFNCATVSFAELASANIVGYSTQDVKAGQFYMVGVQLSDVGAANETADFNTFITTTCTPGTYGDGSEGWKASAPMIQVLQANGKFYDFYYLINDADDGNGNYTATGWVDSEGFNITSDAAQNLSKGFWFKSETAGSLTCAGQVSALSSFERSVPGGQFEIVANPYPTALNLDTAAISGFTPGTYGDGSEGWKASAPMIQVLQANGKFYDFYYLINDADDGNGNYTATGWVDSEGFNITGTQVPVGQAFWIKSDTAGSFTFGL